MNPVTPTSDLVRAAQLGDHRAFTALVRDCDLRMRKLAYRLLGSQAAMDDALQDAYVKAYRKIGTFNGGSSFPTWLYSIVYRTCLDHLRTRNRRRETDFDLTELTLVAGGADPATQAADAEALEAALADLPPDQAAVVVLIDGEGLTYAEAAEILGCREGTIASRLNRAHTALRAVLGADDEEGGDA